MTIQVKVLTMVVALLWACCFPFSSGSSPLVVGIDGELMTKEVRSESGVFEDLQTDRFSIKLENTTTSTDVCSPNGKISHLEMSAVGGANVLAICIDGLWQRIVTEPMCRGSALNPAKSCAEVQHSCFVSPPHHHFFEDATFAGVRCNEDGSEVIVPTALNTVIGMNATKPFIDTSSFRPNIITNTEYLTFSSETTGNTHHWGITTFRKAVKSMDLKFINTISTSNGNPDDIGPCTFSFNAPTVYEQGVMIGTDQGDMIKSCADSSPTPFITRPLIVLNFSANFTTPINELIVMQAENFSNSEKISYTFEATVVYA